MRLSPNRLIAPALAILVLEAAQWLALWGLAYCFKNGIPLYFAQYLIIRNIFRVRLLTNILWGLVFGMVIEWARNTAKAGQPGRASRILRWWGGFGALLTGAISSTRLGLALAEPYSRGPLMMNLLGQLGISFDYVASAILLFAGNPAFWGSLLVLLWGFRSPWRREDTVQVGENLRW